MAGRKKTAPKRRRCYRRAACATPASASEKENGAQGDDAVLVVASGLVLGRRFDVFTHQIQALGQAVVQANDRGLVALYQGAVCRSRFVGRQIQAAFAVAQARLELPDLVGPL